MEGVTARQQIQDCQTPKLSYLHGHADADRRLARGQRQWHCMICSRWKWKDELCPIAKIMRSDAFERLLKRMEEEAMRLPDKKYHMADKIGLSGEVSAICFKKPRAINLKVATWTLRSEAVTCEKCLRLIEGDNYGGE